MANVFSECDCPEDSCIITRKIFSNGADNYRVRCSNCGKPQYMFGSKTIWLQHKYVTAMCKNNNMSLEDLQDDDTFRNIYHEIQGRMSEKERNLWYTLYYTEYMESEEWQEKRDFILDRDRGKCTKCKDEAKVVHHLTYKNVGLKNLDELVNKNMYSTEIYYSPEDIYLFCNEHQDDLTSLCFRCHKKEHYIGRIRI